MSDFGVYVHVPFCAARCDYCAFVTYTGVDELQGSYVEAVLGELELHRRGGELPAASSIFFGGGTPSRLAPELLGSIIEAIERQPGCEVTAELNPEDCSPDRLAQLVDWGVNRFSIGIQSTSPRVLAELGRQHRGDSIEELRRAVADSGVERWSADLIVGARSELDLDVERSLSELLDAPDAPGHLSCYLLTVERGTPLSRDPARHPDDELLARRYELVDELLAARGYAWYEISNWSRPGETCRHNQLYWRQGDYLGLGAAAHSHQSPRRWWNVARLEAYLERVAAGQLPLAGEEVLGAESAAFEALALSLRTSDGVPREAFGSLEGLDDFLVEDGKRVLLTRRGRLLADELVRRLQPTGE